MDVRPETPGPHRHDKPGLRIDPELALTGRRGEQFESTFERELVGGEVRRERGAVLAPLQIRTEPAHPDDHGSPVVVGAERDRVDLPGVDLTEVIHDRLSKSLAALDRGGTAGATARRAVRGVAEVETLEPRDRLLGARRDLVEVVLHAGREVVIHQRWEVLLQQAHDGEGKEGGHEGAPPLPDVAAVLDRLQDAGVGGGPADTQLLEAPYQRGLGVAGRRLGGVLLGGEGFERERDTAVDLGQADLVDAARFLQLVVALPVDAQEPGRGDDRPSGSELGHGAPGCDGGRRRRGTDDTEPRRGPGRVDHLRGDRALPDELVEPPPVTADARFDLTGEPEAVAGRPDRLVGLLGVLHAPLVGAGALGD